MNETVCIKGADWVAAWDPAREDHVYARNWDVVFAGDTITHVGPGYDGPAERTIDGRGFFVMPGLIDIHSHPMTEGSYKGVREEHGVPEMYMTGLYERSLAFSLDEEGRVAGLEAAYAELMMSGVTTIADLSGIIDGWVEVAAKSGMRAFLAPGYASCRWKLDNSYELLFDWNEPAGQQAFENALRFVDEIAAHPSRRLSGIISPAQIETCTEGLLRDSIAAANERNMPITTHISQSVVEFNEMVRRHGKTPVQYALDVGLLGPRCILGHCMFIDEHSSLRWHTRRDLKILAETNTSIAHCPTPFARYGDKLENLGRYLHRGINLGMGTDTAPHNLLEEMRLALIVSHLAAKDIHSGSTADVFRAATIGGAKALGRDDIGRLAPGKKADIAMVDLDVPEMKPMRDPLKSLIYHAAERAVRHVFIDGEQIVRDRNVLTLDREDALARLQDAQARMIRDVPDHDHARRTAEEIAPLSLPVAH